MFPFIMMHRAKADFNCRTRESVPHRGKIVNFRFFLIKQKSLKIRAQLTSGTTLNMILTKYFFVVTFSRVRASFKIYCDAESQIVSPS